VFTKFLIEAGVAYFDQFPKMLVVADF